jgi:pilus assembly protein Flp/PilA
MKNTISNLMVKMQGLMQDNGQDLVEYALVMALIAFAATTGMKSVATSVNTTFTNISTTMTANMS